MDGYRKRKLLLTKRVLPQWYHRYGDILPEINRTYVQPLREIKEEKAMLEAMRTPPNVNAEAEELVKKLMNEKTTRVKAVLKILEGKTANLDIKSLKPIGNQSPLAILGLDKHRVTTERLHLRQRAIRPPGFVLRPNSKWRLFWENKLVMKKFRNMVMDYHSAQIHAKWRKAIRLVRCCVRFASAIAIIGRTTAEVFKEFRNVYQEQNVHDNALAFDKSKFKYRGTGNTLDTESQFTLTKPERYRSPQEIYKAAVSLKFLQAFSNFPFDLQEKMAKVGWLIEVPRDRVIIREGQEGHCFYFLIAGSVAMAKIQGAPHRAATGFDILKTYEIGDIIGVDALTDRGMRAYSICSTEDSKLISVNVDDYNRSCLTSRIPGENPDHIRLLSQLACMRFFPMRKLTEDALDNVILFYYAFHGDACDEALWEVVVSWPKSRGNPKFAGWFCLMCQSSVDTFGSLTNLTAMQHRLSLKRRESFLPGIQSVVDMVDILTRRWTMGTIATSLQQKSQSMTKSEFNLVTAASVEKVVPKDASGTKRKLSSVVQRQWLLVKKLQESDVIGIETLDLGDSIANDHARIAVISEGAEVILVSKDFFMQNASSRMCSDLRALSYIFPNEAALKGELARQKHWRRYQTKIMKDVFGKRKPPAI